MSLLSPSVGVVMPLRSALNNAQRFSTAGPGLNRLVLRMIRRPAYFWCTQMANARPTGFDLLADSMEQEREVRTWQIWAYGLVCR